jgi:hypothetical protein
VLQNRSNKHLAPIVTNSRSQSVLVTANVEDRQAIYVIGASEGSPQIVKVGKDFIADHMVSYLKYTLGVWVFVPKMHQRRFRKDVHKKALYQYGILSIASSSPLSKHPDISVHRLKGRKRSAIVNPRPLTGVLSVHFSGEAYNAGIETQQRPGGTVRVYTVAKTVADCFKYRNRIGVDVAIEALRDSW